MKWITHASKHSCNSGKVTYMLLLLLLLLLRISSLLVEAENGAPENCPYLLPGSIARPLKEDTSLSSGQRYKQLLKNVAYRATSKVTRYHMKVPTLFTKKHTLLLALQYYAVTLLNREPGCKCCLF
jgi:hypothetical protein